MPSFTFSSLKLQLQEYNGVYFCSSIAWIHFLGIGSVEMN